MGISEILCFVIFAFQRIRESYRFVLSWTFGSSGIDKKDAEASKIVTSPYNCTAEAIFGGRKSG